MPECDHNCSSCASRCSEAAPQSLLAPANEHSHIRRVIAVVSGKGGVGKSLVTGLMACELRRRGHSVAVLDADITGPSVPRMFGCTRRAEGDDDGILPVETRTGIRVMSINNLLENDTDPVIWRGSLIAGTVKQFWSDVVWGDVDYMFVDMPPGTGDVPLTVFQSLPVDGILVVTSPQELVSMIVKKALHMAKLMNVPVLGLVENMSWMACPCCGKKVFPFGEGRTEKAAASEGVPLLAQLPIDPSIAGLCDSGRIEEIPAGALDTAAEIVESIG